MQAFRLINRERITKCVCLDTFFGAALATAITTGDFNGDGKTDLAVANSNGNGSSVSVLLRNTVNTGFDAKVDYTTGGGARSVSTGDFNGDGRLDLLVYNVSTSTVSVLLRNPTNTGFDTKDDYATGADPISLTAGSTGDFNNDGKIDFAVANYSSNTVSVFLRNASNTGFDSKIDYTGGANPHSIAVGDFNGDGKLDLAETNNNGGNVSVLLRNSTNTGFDAKVDYATGWNPHSLGVGDFNNDGKLDLVVTNYWNSSISVLLRNSTNTGFDNQADYTVGTSPFSVCVGDFNGDGKIDVAANQGSNTISVLLNTTLSSVVVSPSQTAPTGNVTISGAAQQNQTLTAINTLADVNNIVGAISYQWLSGGTVVSNQTSYTLSQNDVGKSVSVTASYTDGLNKLESVTSSSVTVTNVNDLPTGSVLITGTPIQGQVLTASNTLADADGLGVISYEWLNNGVAISGNTASSYTLVASDVGNAISVKASYTDLQGIAESVTSSATALIAAPTNQSPAGNVTISGTAAQNQTLTANNNLTDANNIVGSISYQWLSNNVAISGATNAAYSLTQTDVGKSISVKASYTDGLSKLETVTSSAVTVSNVNDLPTGSVSILGTATQGQTLTASNTLADLDGLGTISYQWLNNGIAISGATVSTYTLTASDVGKAISVKASYVDLQNIAENKVSDPTTLIIAPTNQPPTGTLTISGTTLQLNQTLLVNNALNDANGLGTMSYQWLSNGSPISGATQVAYTTTANDAGKSITVTASYTDGLGKLESVTSSAVNIAQPQTPPTGSVTISGTAQPNQTLTASHIANAL